eukprot:365100-Alexandrium_andersonii.AAC.1
MAAQALEACWKPLETAGSCWKQLEALTDHVGGGACESRPAPAVQQLFCLNIKCASGDNSCSKIEWP